MKRLTIYTILVVVLAVVALAFSQRAQTQEVPEEVAVPEVVAGGTTTPVFSYQGQLLDGQGNPVTDNVPMIFRLFLRAIAAEQMSPGSNRQRAHDFPPVSNCNRRCELLGGAV
jgi:hypothetical protein